MAIFNGSAASKRSAPESALAKEPDANEFTFDPVSAASPAAASVSPIRASDRDAKESLIAADLSIEGKIQGAGHVRIAGRFKGDVQVEGDLTVEVGARITGSVRARRVVIAGELEGNVESAERVELFSSAVMSGDIKAGTVTVAAGARMRGQVEFGWNERDAGSNAGA